ncbi:hypothetical protein [Streptomyces sp. DSM 15324]|uniref:hypothetical protein n=1 Tax=Streptomyces sp. DSM 15324 TaxID=1739111 RepID=UPI000749004D|nr:hypothetical protein [Streptomyces sp. DSM 15324]KUO11901.1 hypothetical protein AQJ58_12155 [Streptomyces sp. DSM 15324]
MVRRPLALVVALVLFAEGFGIGLLNWALGIMADSQNMSMAGIDPDVMATSSKVGGIVFGFYFAVCGLVALLVAVRNRAPSLLGRILLISAAVTHGLLGAFAWGLLGPAQFTFMVVVLGLIVLLLMTYDAPPRPAAEAPRDGEPGDGEPGKPGDGSAVTPPAAPTAQ